MLSRRTLTLLVGLVVAAGCTSTSAPATTTTTQATPPSLTAPANPVRGSTTSTPVPAPDATANDGSLPTIDDDSGQWPVSTSRGEVFALEGGDGDEGSGGVRYPAIDADLGPLPNPMPSTSYDDAEAIARQWVGIKLVTAGIHDGPLWPYSVSRHLHALSEPAGQSVPGGAITSVETISIEYPDSYTAQVAVAVDVLDHGGTTRSFRFDLTLWLAIDDSWLVAFASAQETE